MTDARQELPPAPPRPPKDPMVLVEGPGPVVDARRRSRLSLRLGVAGVLTVVLLPIALLLNLAAIVVGLRARRAARAAGEPRPGNVLGIGLGVLGLALCTGLTALVVTLWSPFSEWTDCVRAADGSAAAEDACQERLRAEVRDRIGRDLPGLG